MRATSGSGPRASFPAPALRPWSRRKKKESCPVPWPSRLRERRGAWGMRPRAQRRRKRIGRDLAALEAAVRAEETSVRQRLIGQVEELDHRISERADRTEDENRDQGGHQTVFDQGGPILVGSKIPQGKPVPGVLHTRDSRGGSVTGSLTLAVNRLHPIQGRPSNQAETRKGERSWRHRLRSATNSIHL